MKKRKTHEGKTNLKGIAPWALVLAGLLIVVGFLGWSYFSGAKVVAKFCQAQNQNVCSGLPFEGVDQVYYGADGSVKYMPAGTQSPPFEGVPSPAPTQQQAPVQQNENLKLAVKDFNAIVEEPLSLDRGVLNSTFRFFNPVDDLENPNTAAFTTVTVSQGSGSRTNWNVVQTETPYHVVLDGAAVTGAGWYDIDMPNFVFSIDKYQKALGTYAYITTGGHRIGTLGTIADVSLTSGLTISSNVLTYNETAAAGQFTVRLNVTNSAANTLIKCLAIQSQADISEPLEGNEVSSITSQLVSGKDLGIPSDLTTYILNYVPITIGNVKGGEKSIYEWTFNVNEANTGTDDTMNIFFDDLCGYRVHDALINNKGINATNLQVVFDI